MIDNPLDADAPPTFPLAPHLDPGCVAFYKGAYRGRVAILCGGTSIDEQPLERISCPILGINESWRPPRGITYPRTWAHLLSDWRGADAYGAEVVKRWPLMLTFQKISRNTHVPGAIPLLASRVEHFSLDMHAGSWNVAAPVLALQLVVYLGFTDIVFVGLDLKRRGSRLHWWDAAADVRDPARDWHVQAHALRRCAAELSVARPDVAMCNVSHDTACDAFVRRGFGDVFGIGNHEAR